MGSVTGQLKTAGDLPVAGLDPVAQRGNRAALGLAELVALGAGMGQDHGGAGCAVPGGEGAAGEPAARQQPGRRPGRWRTSAMVRTSAWEQAGTGPGRGEMATALSMRASPAST
jgi:hypothetical protein